MMSFSNGASLVLRNCVKDSPKIATEHILAEVEARTVFVLNASGHCHTGVE